MTTQEQELREIEINNLRTIINRPILDMEKGYDGTINTCRIIYGFSDKEVARKRLNQLQK